MCQQVPVPNLPAGVHEAGKSVEKADAIFSQERDPRFAEMFAGISASKWANSARLWALLLDHLEIHPREKGADKVSFVSLPQA